MNGDPIYEIDLPIPPSVNNLFVNATRGRGRFISPRYKRWRAETVKPLLESLRPREAIDYPVEVEILVTRRCRSDLDNIAKPLLDFMVKNHIISDDNKKIVQAILLVWDDCVQGVRVNLYDARP